LEVLAGLDNLGKYKTTWAPSVSFTIRTTPRPRRPPLDSDRLAHAHSFTAVVSHPLFPSPRHHRPPPRAVLRGAHRRRSSSFFSSSCSHTPPLLLLALCRCQPSCPATKAPPESTTSPLPGRPSFRSFLREKAPRTAAAFPRPSDTSRRQASLAALSLRRCHPNNRSCSDHHPELRAADHHHRTPPLTAVPLRPSRAPWKLPLR
jgi:hypothetical protein